MMTMTTTITNKTVTMKITLYIFVVVEITWDGLIIV